MYCNLGKLLRPVVDQMPQHITPLQKSRLMAFVIGRAIATIAPLPSTPTGAADVHFNLMHSTQAYALISAINEDMVIDTELTYSMAISFYRFRYGLVHDVQATFNLVDLLATFATDYFPEQLKEDVKLFSDQEIQRSAIIMSMAIIRECPADQEPVSEAV